MRNDNVNNLPVNLRMIQKRSENTQSNMEPKYCTPAWKVAQLQVEHRCC